MTTHPWTYRDDFRPKVFDRLDRNKDCLIASVGDRGAGKSTDTFQVAWNLDATFTAERMIHSGRLLWALLGDREAYPPGTVFVFDEAVLALLKYDWATGESKDLIRLINIVRERGYIIFFCIPHWGSLNAEVKKHFHWLIEFRDKGNDEFNYGYFFERGLLRQFSKKLPAFHRRGDGVKFFNVTKWKNPKMVEEFYRYEENKRNDVDRYGQETAPGDVELEALPDAIRTIRTILVNDGIPTA